MQEAGIHVHAYCIPLPMDYAPLILTKRTFFTFSDINEMNLITVISSRHLPYLCTQEGVSPGIPSNPMMSPGSCGLCLHSLILVSQSALSIQSANQHSVSDEAMPPWSAYTVDMPHSLHSDSDQQKDNINCTPPLTSSTFTSDHLLHQHVLTMLRHSLHQCSPVTIASACYHPPLR